MKKKLVIIYGPTGSGKTACALSLAATYKQEIINADVGQLYTPLSIGTAKPNWQQELIAHHLFDQIDQPQDYTVVAYKNDVMTTADAIIQRGNIPFLVGGSGFYLLSLFFPPYHHTEEKKNTIQYDTHLPDKALWDLLAAQDPERAQAIHYNDRYRVERALQVGGSKNISSDFQPHYTPLPYGVLFLFLHPDRKQLYHSINARTEIMFKQGWISEVAGLLDTPWEDFLMRKKLIGYNDIITYLRSGNITDTQEQKLRLTIAQKTRHYAKRQITFWRMVQKKLQPHLSDQLHIAECHSQEQAHEKITTFLHEAL